MGSTFVSGPTPQHFELSQTASSYSPTQTVYDMAKLPSLHKDPYVLAYKYWDYLTENPRLRRESCNPYYENLLANQPDPDGDATDDRSRAIRYAKTHYECFYEIRDIDRIIGWLGDAAPT
ncbi:uncharacterized protein K460DRAFT_409988 [Cucurbitaria berberidis CBS 394.84]|uniref:Uncharacterized protein n=1 Tax=Cucurbitaria berberidis CBS 394.84 TaxID=1168544 RepID=A0A9P4L551_9PLEO|nr:uncharacterized protein K460DRAFT_409988 [Cucurbitaria berberidis CBS 394.84]KAF1842586.1 hypothetical protein K460DRAFT_409988 [Cucurbitaria berberidis CBS 394.84]